MTEKPREYKKRVDETREKRRKNRDKLLEFLQEYELVDEKYKAKTKKEILANFEENEKAEKGSELYIKIFEELSNIEIKYKNLEILKKTFEEKKRKKNEKIGKLRGYSMTGEDETTIKIQRAEMKKIENEINIINEEIKAIEQEIKEKEAEIKDIEEIYGEKKGQEEIEEEEKKIVEIESKKDDNEQKSGTGETLREHRRKTLKELQKIDHTRHEIIKLLNEGIGVDEGVKNEIKDEVSKKFFDYYSEKTGTIKMKASELNLIRSIKYSRKYEKIDKRIEINGIPIYKIIKDGKQSLLIGNKELGSWFDDIYEIKEIGGKLYFQAKKDGKQCIIWGTEQQGDWFEKISYVKEIGGKLCYGAEMDGKRCIMYGTEQYSDWFDGVRWPNNIGGKPCFQAKKDGKQCIIWGKEQYSDWFDMVGDPEDIGGKPCFVVKRNFKYSVMQGGEQQCDWFDGIWNLQEIGGKPCFKAEKGGKWCVMRGNEQQGDWYYEIGNPEEIGGKPCFIAKREDGKKCIMWGKEQIGDYYNKIYDDIKEIGGKPCFRGEKDGEMCVMWGNEQQGDWFDITNNLQDIGGKPVFGARERGKGWSVMQGNERISEWFHDLRELKNVGGKIYFKIEDNRWHIRTIRGKEEFEEISDTQEIGGKPCFQAKKNGKYGVFRGNEQLGDLFDIVRDIIEIGGKPCFRAKKGGKWCVMRGNEQQGDWYYEIGNPEEIGGKPCFIAKREDGKKCIMWGKEQQGDWYAGIRDPEEIGGKPCFVVIKKNRGQQYIIRGNEECGKRERGIGKFREIGGKLCYTKVKESKKNKKYCLNRGDGEQSEWFDSIENVITMGIRPIYFAKRDGEYIIMYGNVQITEGFNNYKKIDEDKQMIKYKITYEDGFERIVTINKNLKKLTNGSNKGKILQQEELVDEQFETQRGLRENIIISRYEKLLNLKELIKYLKENKIYEEGEFEELKKKLIENFFLNYENAKENDEFKAAENEYRKLKMKTREHISKEKELKKTLLEDSEILENMDTKMLKIADEIMKTERGSLLKMLGLNKLRNERDELEKHKNRIMSLQKEKFKLRMQIQEQMKTYGPKIDRRKLKGKSDEELRKWLNLGEIAKVKTLKEYKEKHNEIIENSEKIIGFIKTLDLGISDEIKYDIIQKIEKFIRSSIEIQETGDLLKMANDTEKYIEENIGNIIKELREKKEKIQDIKEKVKSLECQKEKADYEELLRINDEIYELKEIQIKIKNEYDTTVKSINEILYKYDRSDIESRL